MSADKIELVHSGDDYFSRLLDVIDKAQKEIHLQTYIFDNDRTGTEVANALKAAVSRKVAVFVLLDGFGSFTLTRSFCDDLIQHGVQLRFFSPWHSINNVYLGRRMHHKVLVADGHTALIGGINIGDKYRGSSGVLPWLDFAVQIENENIAASLEQLCRKMHRKMRGFNRTRAKTLFRSVGEASVRVIQSDWLNRKKEISTAYLAAIRKAQTEVIIVGSYFLPSRRLLNTLKQAADRGVRIKIILSGVSDAPMVMRATQYLYPSLLKHGIELFEWKKSVLHGKIAVADHEWATVGSFNLNHLSSYASIEMNVEIRSAEFSKQLYEHLGIVVQQCESITPEAVSSRSGAFTRLANWLAYGLLRLGLVIITYIPYKRFRVQY